MIIMIMIMMMIITIIIIMTHATELVGKFEQVDPHSYHEFDRSHHHDHHHHHHD